MAASKAATEEASANFAAILASIRPKTVAEVSDALRELVAKVRDTGKAGTLSLEVLGVREGRRRHRRPRRLASVGGAASRVGPRRPPRDRLPDHLPGLLRDRPRAGRLGGRGHDPRLGRRADRWPLHRPREGALDRPARRRAREGQGGTAVTERTHGTGWAGIPRYIARTRAAGRVAQRGAKIDEIVAEIAGESSAPYREHLTEVLTAMREAQDADLTLLQELDRTEDGPLVRHRWQPRSTYNGEDDHVASDQWGER